MADIEAATRQSARSLATYLLAKYGREEFDKLIELFLVGAPSGKIAYAYQVSRQRVHQWRCILGVMTRTYQVHPEVQALMPRESRTTRRTVV